MYNPLLGVFLNHFIFSYNYPLLTQLSKAINGK